MSEFVNVNGKEVPVEQFRSDWALALMSQGVIVRLGISRWRAKTRLTPDILGLKFVDDKSQEFMKKYVKLGEQKLLPPEILSEIERLERRARDILSTYSFHTVWGKFVPFTAFERWESENAIVQNDFMQMAVALGTRYDSIIASLREDYRNMARDVWARLYPEDTGGPTESFIENFVAKIIEKIPTRDIIVSSFKYDVTYFVVPMPSFIEESVARAEEIRRSSEMAEFENQLERNTKRRIAEDYQKRKRELIDGFLESTVMSMREYVKELCDNVLESIGKQNKVGKLTNKNINKLKKMTEKVRILNFYDDKEISSLMEELEIEIEKFKGERDEELIVDKLRKIAEVGGKEFLPVNFNPAISYLEV